LIFTKIDFLETSNFCTKHSLFHPEAEEVSQYGVGAVTGHDQQ